VWLSEIMLQQTQVSTVLAYYPRFLARFPDVASLAAAPLDDVLALWSGLGYYSRARHLHRCAQQVVAEWGGAFPPRSADLQTLSGIGRSTAAAIASFCFGEPVSILDGNVKRVLTRLLAFDGNLAVAAQEKALWALAQALVPAQPEPAEMARYTQGLMDLGATVCTRSQPQCLLCPAQTLCAARAQGRPTAFPVKTRKLLRRTEAWWLLVWRRPDGAVWLQQRPQTGIWSGLFAFPVLAGRDELLAAAQTAPERVVEHPVLRHSLTHRELLLYPVEVPWRGVGEPPPAGVLPTRWVKGPEALDLGLPAPLRTWLLARWAA
jgi:A/G-specific adenine glycosylase